MTTLFGIKNCDTVKKARDWLDQRGLGYHFHDFRADGISHELIAVWLQQIPKDQLINRRSTTWKQLSATEQALFDQPVLNDSALALLLSQPTLIKRPLLAHADQILVGFKANDYAELLSHSQPVHSSD